MLIDKSDDIRSLRKFFFAKKNLTLFFQMALMKKKLYWNSTCFTQIRLEITDDVQECFEVQSLEGYLKVQES